jgi:cell division transport system permease protein
MEQAKGRLPQARRARKTNPTYLNSILMISLVLILLGSVGTVLLLAQIYGEAIKEQVRVSAYLKDNVNEVEMLQLRKKIEAEPFARSIEYISKNEALQKFMARERDTLAQQILGDINPLPASFEIRLQAAYVQPDSMQAISDRLQLYREVRYTRAHRDVVSRLNDDFQTIGLVLIGASVIILLIAITLIDKTIRLAMYSNRFIIRSMQLVGATRWFIIGPYIKRSVLNGLVAGLIAIGALAGLIFYGSRYLSSLDLREEYFKFAALFAGVLLAGILISWWSTQRSVSKYLKMKLDELY